METVGRFLTYVSPPLIAISLRSKELVGATGFEPATPCAQGPCPAIVRNFLQDRTSKWLIHRWIWRYDPLSSEGF